MNGRQLRTALGEEKFDEMAQFLKNEFYRLKRQGLGPGVPRCGERHFVLERMTLFVKSSPHYTPPPERAYSYA